MLEPNLRCRWVELQIGDRVLRDGEIAFTINGPPFVSDGRVAFRVTGAGKLKIVTVTDPQTVVPVVRPSA